MFYNKLNKFQIKLLWIFINIDIVLVSIKNKIFLQLSDPLTPFLPINGVNYNIKSLLLIGRLFVKNLIKATADFVGVLLSMIPIK